MRKFEVLQSDPYPGCPYSAIEIIDTSTSECIADVSTTVADAKLMAAGPELLHQLKRLVAFVEVTLPEQAWVLAEAREVIHQIDEV